MVKKITTGSLFAGIEGFGLASKRLGITHKWSVEINQFCQRVIKKHFPDSDVYGDIEETKDLSYVDIITGGFPCQDISVSNSKATGIMGSRSGLWSEFARIISEIRPRAVIIENSPMLLQRGFERVLYDLSEIGYDAEWQCLTASQFGYPHKRERLYVIAYTSKKGRGGLLHNNQGSVFKEVKKTNALDRKSNPFLQFEQISGQPAVFRVDDGVPNRMDIVNRLEACGNAVIPEIAEYLFKCLIDIWVFEEIA